MPLQFILGGTGSGKSTCLCRDLLNRSQTDGTPYFLVVPEQYTMKTQQKLVAMQAGHSVFSIDIVSFARLSYRIFEELNINTPDLIDETGKCLVLRRVLDEVKDDLTVYGAKAGSPGFVEKMKSMISECAQYRLDEDALEGMIQASEHKPLLAAKLRDTKLIYHAFRSYLQEHYITQEEVLDRFLAVIPDSKLLRGSEVAFDGFVGQPFTPVQYRIIGALLKVCRKVTVTLCISRDVAAAGNSGMLLGYGIFSFGLAAYRRIAKMAEEAGEEVLPDIILSGGGQAGKGESRESVYEKASGTEKGTKFSGRAREIDHLEAHLFRHYGTAKISAGNTVGLYACRDPREEAVFAAEKIREAAESGLRYREIAVVTADMKTYRRYLEAAFRDYGIPFFVDDKTGLMEHPFIEAQRSFLDILATDFTYESVMRFLRCGFHPFSVEDVDAFAMYLRATGLRGFSRWNQPFTWVSDSMTEEDLKKFDGMRETFLSWTWDFKRGRQAAPVTQWIARMRNLLDQLDMETHLTELSAMWRDAAEYDKADATDQLFAKTDELYEKTGRLLPDEVVTAKEFLDILTSGFEDMKVAVIPPTLDQVMILDSGRSRSGDINLLIFPGMNDGAIPKTTESNGILSQGDREFLKQMRFEMAPTAREASGLEMFSLYTWLSKPAGGLILTFALSDMQGQTKKPSAMLKMVQALYTNLAVRSVDLQTVRSKKEAKKRLAAGLKEELLKPLTVGLSENEAEKPLAVGLSEKEPVKLKPLAADPPIETGNSFSERKEESLSDFSVRNLYRIFSRPALSGQDTEDSRFFNLVLQGTFFGAGKEQLSEEAAGGLFAEGLYGSVTALEQYAACGYRFFLEHGLGLEEPQEYRTSAADIGTLFHEALSIYSKNMQKQGLRWGETSEETRRSMVHEAVAQAAAESKSQALCGTARSAYLVRKVERITDRSVWVLGEHIRRSLFYPAYYELPIGNGRVDRVDLYEANGTVYVKVIDYKSGKTKFDFMDTYYGLQMQLVLYLAQVLSYEEHRTNGKKIVPAGIFYYNLKDPMLEAEKDDVSYSSGLTDETSSGESRTDSGTPGVSDGHGTDSAVGVRGRQSDERLLAEFKMTGIVNQDPEIIAALDQSLADGTGSSVMIPVAYTKSGLKKTSQTLSTEQFEALTSFAAKKADSLREDIREGKIPVNPYRRGNSVPCEYCAYQGVCGFDRKLPGFRYRNLAAMSREEVLEAILESASEDEEEE
ncbi:MAG: exodeoxyribonuclease V subunit gamma [Lachnospiraceae bacterium]|nr:exodeoxyribonuclease V subunit gamma [Lachnospiraceae bacterium]